MAKLYLHFILLILAFCFNVEARKLSCQSIFKVNKFEPKIESKVEEIEITPDLLKNRELNYENLLKIVSNKITVENLKDELIKLKVSNLKADFILKFIKKLDSFNEKKGEYLSEFYLELQVLKYIHENFTELTPQNSSQIIIDRISTSNYYPKDSINDIIILIKEISKLSPAAVLTANIKPKDFFLQPEAQLKDQIDGLTLRKRLKILKWLEGNYSQISTSKELRDLVLGIPELRAKYDKEFGWRTCTIYNPIANQKLNEMGLFLVREILPGRNAMQTQHTFLKFYPANGGDPIILDFTFKQFINNDKFESGIFVGTEQELHSLFKKYKLMKYSFYFETLASDRVLDEQSIDSNVIKKLKQNLEDNKRRLSQ